ncbi:class I SAM-dependent methyltransferase [Pseudomonas neustonica]|uniref:Methyltransferase n=1 Tax=Pseudomonas neustonica TaxID=2487346 RepID=A0ABX9XIJ9_9PSED|nr:MULTISPECIES: class I SAM-dependent methyltransferase [Pseudomonas]MAB23915.1 methyltransferase [Pseudomonadales bacterium]ROZ83162.1 methyltransferase [Pseudomonas neustonica]ROZ86834.1 methyltransferase [Pseudomonas sp. SSM44]|tara:strand:+ start:594 stop:1436 length:843 start_codon:yes stop_codon:yes gene_type:complete
MNRLLVAASALFLSGAVLAQDAVSPPQITQAQQQALGDAVASTSRGITNVMRDAYRNPQHTLAFFGITPGQTVIEVWPGAGWYTEILAPLLRDEGKLIAAHFDPESDVAFFRRSRADFAAKLAEDPQWYDKVELSTLNYDPQLPLAEPGSADRVLTFRNVHNWLAAGDDKAAQVFDKFYAALKPGGMLGVVEHQARAGTSLEDMIKTGYVTQAKVRELAEAAGFEMISISPVNQNVQDTKDHPEGVWTLPPTLRLGDKDRARYLAIGESDRMTLLFIKPE